MSQRAWLKIGVACTDRTSALRKTSLLGAPLKISLVVTLGTMTRPACLRAEPHTHESSTRTVAKNCKNDGSKPRLATTLKPFTERSEQLQGALIGAGGADRLVQENVIKRLLSHSDPDTVARLQLCYRIGTLDKSRKTAQGGDPIARPVL